MMVLCCWGTGVSSPLLSAVPQPRRHGELLASVDSPVMLPKCRGRKVFLPTNKIYIGLEV